MAGLVYVRGGLPLSDKRAIELFLRVSPTL